MARVRRCARSRRLRFRAWRSAVARADAGTDRGGADDRGAPSAGLPVGGRGQCRRNARDPRDRPEPVRGSRADHRQRPRAGHGGAGGLRARERLCRAGSAPSGDGGRIDGRGTGKRPALGGDATPHPGSRRAGRRRAGCLVDARPRDGHGPHRRPCQGPPARRQQRDFRACRRRKDVSRDGRRRRCCRNDPGNRDRDGVRHHRQSGAGGSCRIHQRYARRSAHSSIRRNAMAGAGAAHGRASARGTDREGRDGALAHRRPAVRRRRAGIPGRTFAASHGGHRERATVQRDEGGAGAADRHRRGAAGDQQLGGRHGAGVRQDPRQLPAPVRHRAARHLPASATTACCMRPRGAGRHCRPLPRTFPKPLSETISARVIRRAPDDPDTRHGGGDRPAERPAAGVVELIGNCSIAGAPMLWEDRGVGSITVLRQPPRPSPTRSLRCSRPSPTRR